MLWISIRKTRKDTEQEKLKINQEKYTRTTWRSMKNKEHKSKILEKIIKDAIDTKLRTRH